MLNYMIAAATHKDVFGQELSEGEIAKVLSPYDHYACLVLLSRVATAYSLSRADNFGQVQVALVSKLFSDEDQQKILAFANNEEGSIVVFHDAAILALAKLVLRHASVERGKPLEPEDIEQFGRLLVAMNDRLYPDIQRDIHVPETVQIEDFREATIADQFSRSEDELPYLLARFNDLFLELPNEQDVKERLKRRGVDLDIGKLFGEATDGVELADFFSIGLMLLFNWQKHSFEKLNVEKVVLSPSGYFANSRLESDVIERILDVLSFEAAEFGELYDSDVGDILSGEDYPFNFLIFDRWPLVKFENGTYVCLSPVRLARRITHGVYWIIHDHLLEKDDDEVRAQLPRYFGEVLEVYVGLALRSGFGDEQCLLGYTDPDDPDKIERADVIVLQNTLLTLLEIKSLHWRYVTRVAPTRENVERDLSKSLIGNKAMHGDNKGLGQLKNNIDSFLNGEWKLPRSHDLRIGNILPAIIAGDDVPMDGLSRKLYDELAAAIGFATPQNELVRPYLILSVNEIETLEAIAQKSGAKTAIRLLEEYSKLFKDTNELGIAPRSMPFRNFLRERGLDTVRNARLGKKYFAIGERAKNRIFGNSSTAITSK